MPVSLLPGRPVAAEIRIQNRLLLGLHSHERLMTFARESPAQ